MSQQPWLSEWRQREDEMVDGQRFEETLDRMDFDAQSKFTDFLLRVYWFLDHLLSILAANPDVDKRVSLEMLADLFYRYELTRDRDWET